MTTLLLPLLLFCLLTGSSSSSSISDWFTERCPGEKQPSARLAFCIMTHSDANLTGRLLRTIYSRQHAYALLPDLNSGAEFIQQVQQLVTPAMSWHGNVYVLEPRTVLRFGISMVDAELHCMQQLLGATDFDYFINLSESHYPLHPVSQLADELRRCAPARLNFMELAANRLRISHLLSDQAKEGMLLQRHGRVHIDTGIRSVGIVHVEKTSKTRPFFQGGDQYVIRRASQWMVIHRSLCEHALSSLGRSLLLFFSTKGTSDAHYFPTLALNDARFNSSVIPHGLHRHYWDCRAPNGHACIIKTWDKVKKAADSTDPPYFFIRKFDANNSHTFMSRLDSTYLNMKGSLSK